MCCGESVRWSVAVSMWALIVLYGTRVLRAEPTFRPGNHNVFSEIVFCYFLVKSNGQDFVASPLDYAACVRRMNDAQVVVSYSRFCLGTKYGSP